MTTLQDIIERIDFNIVKEIGESQNIKFKNHKYFEYISFDYHDCFNTWTYYLRLKKGFPFHHFPTKDGIPQSYKRLKNMLNRLYKDVSPDTEVIGV